MFRSLIIVTALILVFLLIKRLLASARSRKTKTDGTKTNTSNDTVQCIECNTYIPATEAIHHNNKYYCCRQHQRDWQSRQT